MADDERAADIALKRRKLERKLARLNIGLNIELGLNFLIYLVTLLFPLGLWGYQIYFWLRNGQWLTRTLIDFGVIMNPNPSDWVGLVTVLDWITSQNAGWVVLVFGGIILWIANKSFSESQSKIYSLEDQLEAIREK